MASAHLLIENARRRACMSFTDLWVAYFALGGVGAPAEVRAYLAGSGAAPSDFDVLVQAINERFLEQGEDHPVPYREDLP